MTTRLTHNFSNTDLTVDVDLDEFVLCIEVDNADYNPQEAKLTLQQVDELLNVLTTARGQLAYLIGDSND